MKKLLFTLIGVLALINLSIGQCNVLFSFAAYFNQVTFINQSAVSNAHYFWDFGDGTGSNFANPVHTYPDNGNYFVTLFAEDTVSKCSSYYEYWVDVTKYSTDTCQPSISDSLSSYGGPELTVFNTSMNCNNYNVSVSGGNAWNFPSGSQMYLGTSPFNMVCIGQYYDNFGHLRREAYKTAYYNYSNSHNYGSCSANFEFVPVSRNSSGEMILFTAMNKSAIHYTWYITGFGNPIISHNDTVSQLYPCISPDTWVVELITQDSNGCHDTVCRNIAVSDSIKTTLGVNDLKNIIGKVSVYPNPNTGTFTLSLSNVNTACNIEIYNMLGENIYQAKINSSNTEINIKGQAQGVYLYRVIAESGQLIGDGKIIIQK